MWFEYKHTYRECWKRLRVKSTRNHKTNGCNYSPMPYLANWMLYSVAMKVNQSQRCLHLSKQQKILLWVDRKADPLCDFELWPHPWPWPQLSWPHLRNGSVKMERKGCESMGCWATIKLWAVAFTLDFQSQIKKKKRIPGMGQSIDMTKGRESIRTRTHFMTLNFDLTHDLEWDFQIFNQPFVRNGRAG